jgi:hypothetical protein
MRWNPKTVLGASGIVASIYGVMTAIFLLTVDNTLSHDFTVNQNGGTLTQSQATQFGLGVLALGGIAGLVYFIAQVILTGVLTVTVGQGVLGRKETLGGAFTAAFSRFWPLLGVIFFEGLFLGGGFLLTAIVLIVIIVLLASAHVVAAAVIVGILGFLAAIFFAIMIGVRWLLAVPAVMLEQTGPLQAMGRSWRLTRGGAWRVFGIMLLTGLIVSIFSYIIQIPFTIAGEGVTFASVSSHHVTLVGAFIAAIGQVISVTLSAPITAAVIALLYADLRMRREGLDIVLQAAAAQPAGPGAAGPWMTAPGTAPPGAPPPGAPPYGAAPPSCGPASPGAGPYGPGPSGPNPGPW